MSIINLQSYENLQSVGNHVGVAEPFLMRMAHGAPMPVSDKTREKSTTLHRRMQSKGASASSNCSSEIQILRVSKRFYVSLMLSRLVQVNHFSCIISVVGTSFEHIRKCMGRNFSSLWSTSRFHYSNIAYSLHIHYEVQVFNNNISLRVIL